MSVIEFLAHVWFGIEAADFFDLYVFARVQQLDLHPGFQLAVEHAHMRDDTLVSIEIGIEAQGLH